MKYGRCYGFVQIKFNDEEILGSNEFGAIDNMWGVFINLLSSYLCDGKASEEFPDYKLEIRLNNYDENHVILELPAIPKSHILPKKEFITSWINGAILYSESLAYYDNDNKLYFPDEETKTRSIRIVKDLLNMHKW